MPLKYPFHNASLSNFDALIHIFCSVPFEEKATNLFVAGYLMGQVYSNFAERYYCTPLESFTSALTDSFFTGG